MTRARIGVAPLAEKKMSDGAALPLTGLQTPKLAKQNDDYGIGHMKQSELRWCV